jgi:hypothetical protein
MKKFVVLSFAMVLILAFGATVYGQEQKEPVLEFKASGFIDAQSFWFKNATQGFNGGGMYQANAYGAAASGGGFIGGQATQALDSSSVAYLESRCRLKFDAVYGKDLSGTIYFEFDSSPWGNARGGRNSNASAGSIVSERNTFGFWSTDRAALEVKNIYFDFGVPVIPIPITVRIGAQPFGLRTNLFQYTDGMGITATAKVDPVQVSFQFAKPWEGMVWAADDTDMYGVHANVKVSTFTIGGYAQFWDMGTLPIDRDQTSVNQAAQFVFPSGNYGEMWWFGGYADGKIGPVTLNFDFIYDHGFVSSRADGLKPPSVQYDGWVLYGKGDYAIEKANIGLVGYYATGADAAQSGTTGLPAYGATTRGTPSRRVGSYVVPPGSEAGPIFGESVVFYSSWINRGDSGIANTVNYSQMCRGPVGGTWMAKLYTSYKIFPELKMTGQVMYIGDTTKNGDTFGSALGANGTLKDYSYIGTEADLIGELQIYKNLKFSAGYGYMWAGSALKLWSGVRNHMIQNPYQLTTNITYTF